MIIKTDLLKEKSAAILSAVDSNELSVVTETLELKANGDVLSMNVTNREYYVRVNVNLDQPETFNAAVNANLFLKLVSQITTATIELNVTDTNLVVKGNGTYKLPLICDNEEVITLPEIVINNVTVEETVHSDILNSILDYNTRELTRGTISRPVQKMYYMDEKGAITFTSGACVNSFDLSKPMRVLLNQRIVKLFRLFKNVDVKLSLGYDSISDSIIQTKIKFETKDIQLTAVLSSDDSLINSVPVTAIRNRSDKDYDYSVIIDKEALLQSISRLLLFSSGIGSKEVIKPYSLFEFGTDGVKVWDVNKQNSEVIKYANNASITDDYSATLDLVDLKSVLENKIDQYVTLKFGDHQAFVLVKNNIKFVVPEIKQV